MALTTVQAETEMRWEIQYSRFFGYIHVLPSKNKTIQSRGAWLSSSSPTAILYLSSRPSFLGLILSVSFLGKFIEQHDVSKLHFAWPQLSCLSNSPGRASRVVFVSYRDQTGLTQKFALRFSTNHEVGEFVTLLEESFSNRQHLGDLMIAHSSHSEVKDVLSEERPTPTGVSDQMCEMNPIASLKPPKIEQLQGGEWSCSMNIAANHMSDAYVHDASECYAPTLPPRFTTLVTNCSEMVQQGGVVAESKPSLTQDADLKSLIVKYLDDASFLDILTKVEEMIAETGGDMTIQDFV